jgi:hypothetical protein
MVSYVQGIVTFIAVILYTVQFVVYTKNYLHRQTINFTNTGKRYVLFPSAQPIQKSGVICLKCDKVGLQLRLGAEAG